MDNKKGNQMKAEKILELAEDAIYDIYKDADEVTDEIKRLIPGITDEQADKLIADILDMNDEESAKAEVYAEAGYL